MTFAMKNIVSGVSSALAVRATNESDEVYYVSEVHEDDSGLSMEKRPTGAEKHKFIQRGIGPRK